MIFCVYWLFTRGSLLLYDLSHLYYKCLHKQAPNYLSDLLTVRQSTYNTRSSSHTRLLLRTTNIQGCEIVLSLVLLLME